ncbi:osmotically inducible C [Micractinium conductrix]|uniref:Osmotically inducible C n=1 Tax=Micractinium conductrix TaxID=554055 RepID=A0A2P6V520_9CHLO|nr:osmotically inducible C [Micractinium conductrix]|eukprot:PSC69190.1 osmotically inducible C [Micractinium conductrix]
MTVCTACVGEPVKLAEPEAAAKSAHLYEVPLKAAGSGLRTEVQAGEFQIVLDAGRALGGQQSGPSPVQAFVSSILACTQITLQVVAGDAGVGPLGDIRWTAHGVFDTRKLLSNTDTVPHFTSISLHGEVQGALEQAALDALVAGTKARCPISQSLRPEIAFELKLQRAAA